MILNYDWTYILSVDYRFEQEQDRMSDLVERLGLTQDASFFIDGLGHQLEPGRYSQISPPPPPNWTDGPASYAHFSAFRKMIEYSRDRGWKEILILEDDLELTPDFDSVAPQALDQLPDDWDMFYWGANHTDHHTRDVSPNILRCFGSACTHMVAFKDTIFDAVLSLPTDRTIDWNIGYRLHQHFNCYACWPNVALQKPGYSLLWKQQTDYTELFKSKGIQV